MPKMTSLQQMAAKCEGLIDTKDVDEWENGFLINVCNRVRNATISDKQAEQLEKIYNKHFA